MSFTGKTKASTYKDILQVDNSNSGIDTNVRKIKDGEGTESALMLSDDSVRVLPVNDETTSTFQVRSQANAVLFTVDSTNSLIKAGTTQTNVNTQIQGFNLTSVNSNPTTANTWTALSSIGHSRFQTELTFGTGSTPDTSYTISTNADDVVQAIWYIPFNITIDSCDVWFGEDDGSGEVIKFSVMSYDIDASNLATGGDLSNGVENCVSPSTIVAGGYEQAYYQQLTVSSANVDAGKAIVACVHQTATNSDLTINMQLVYHIR